MSYGIRRTIVLAVLPFLRLYGQWAEFVASRAPATSGTFASQAAAIPPLVTEPLAFPRLFFLFFELLLAARPLAAPSSASSYFFFFFFSPQPRISCNGNTGPGSIGTRGGTRLKYRNLSTTGLTKFAAFPLTRRTSPPAIAVRTSDAITFKLL